MALLRSSQVFVAKDEEGIVRVGVIPFLLDESILDTALETSAQASPSSP